MNSTNLNLSSSSFTSLDSQADLFKEIASDLEKLNEIPPEFRGQTIETGLELALNYLATGDISNNSSLSNKLVQLGQEIFDRQTASLLPQASNSVEAGLIQTELNKAKGRLNRRLRLKSKITLKTTNEKLRRLDESLNLGITNIVRKLELAESEGLHPAALSQDDMAKKADLMMQQLIKEEKEAKKSKNKQARTANRKKNKFTSQKSAPATLPKISQLTNKKKITTVSTALSASQALSKEARLSKFVLTLMKDSFHCPEHERVRRWKTEDYRVIRDFVDRDSHGGNIRRYEDLTREQIAEQRAKHYLPGTERLIKNSLYHDIYTFPTDRGVGVVAQLSFNETPTNGVLYFGIGKSHLVFHKYFEEVDFEDERRNVFHDDNNQAETEESSSPEEWTSNQDFNVDISEEGVLKFTYSDHEIRIFPIRKDLFQKALNQQV